MTEPQADKLPFLELPSRWVELGTVDTAPFDAFLDRVPETFWEIEDADKENNFSVFHHTKHIILRFMQDHDDPRSWFSRPVWEILAPDIEPVMREVVATYGFIQPEFPKAMFARLDANSVIDRHHDAAIGNRMTHKIHVPLRTSPEIAFEVQGEFTHLAKGFAYEVNNVRPHGVHNPTDQARVHFIFEVFDDG
jgi:aspartyl/asparaginyl beta-hydroxylase (cupin superfamily)